MKAWLEYVLEQRKEWKEVNIDNSLEGFYYKAEKRMGWCHWWENEVEQQFSISVPYEFLKHAMPDSLVWGTDLFPFRLSEKKKWQQPI